MEITKLKTQGLLIRGKSAALAVDPAINKEKVSPEADAADFAISSEPHVGIEKYAENKRLFSWPGEYEVNGIAVHAHPVDEVDAKSATSLLFLIFVDQLRICYLPALKKELHSDLIEKIGDVDLLIFPNSGDEKVWQPTIEEIEPKSVLPLEIDGGNLSVDSLFSKIGLTKPAAEDKVTIKSKSDLRSDQVAVFLLN